MFDQLERHIASMELPFEDIALEVFQIQYQHNRIYRDWVDALGVSSSSVRALQDIPFLPIQFFKYYPIQTGEWTPVKTFRSSGTTGSISAQHLIKDTTWYSERLLAGFEHFYGDVGEWTVLAMLPSYLERDDASLVYMANAMMQASGHGRHFYLNDYAALEKAIAAAQSANTKVLVIGVTFALLEWAKHSQHSDWTNVVVMETGGMKGRGEELIRSELHRRLKSGLGIQHIHSEYGMTELQSQAYLQGGEHYRCMPQMRVLCRATDDPSQVELSGQGLLNIVDLSNLHTCSFIAADDLCDILADGRFEVKGRQDYAQVRGCNLMA